MKKGLTIFTYPLIIMAVCLVFTWSCTKNDNSSNNNPVPEGITDIDGNEYHTVTIGSQVWMVENLKTTKYNDGTSIPLVTDSATWGSLLTPAFCWYDNDPASYKNIYGGLYNFFAVNTFKLAPEGWHVPTDEDWTILTTYYNGEDVAGGKMKSIGTFEAGTGLWHSPNSDATNENGFTALPGGYRHFYYQFEGMGYNGYWWSNSAGNSHGPWYRCLSSSNSEARRLEGFNTCAFSVRCVKDKTN